MPKEGTATIQKQHCQKVMQFSPIFAGDQYGGSYFSYTSEKYIYTVAYTIYNRKEKVIQEETLKNEVLQPQEMYE